MSFKELFDLLIMLDEHDRIEAKTGQQVGRSLLESICAFSNEPKLHGGYILLGVAPEQNTFIPTYEIVGVNNPEKLQSDIITSCNTSFNIPIRPRITVEKIDEKHVLTIFVPELQESEKPVFFKNDGLPRGAYRRIGSSDVHCTEDDLIVFYQDRKTESYDTTIFTDADLSDIDMTALDEYRTAIASANPDAECINYNNEDLLRSIGCIKYQNGVIFPTVAGITLFGNVSSLRRCLPLTRVDYIRVPGREWVENPDNRFETIEIRMPIMRLVRKIQNAILDDIPKAFSLPTGEMQREDKPRIPDRALREAVVNALMHRDYRVHGPVQVIRYSNRLEIRNPGYSLVSEDELGEPNSQTRNPNIAAVLHETRFAENKGSGIRTMRLKMEEAMLAPPTFESNRDKNQFSVIFLFHHFLGQEDVEWLTQFHDLNLCPDECHALIYVREIGVIDNKDYRILNKVDTLTASQKLRHLRDLGLLRQNGKGSGTYYRPTDRLLSPQNDTSSVKEKDSLSDMTHGLSEGDDDLSGMDHTRLGDETLQERLKRLPVGLRRPPAELIQSIRTLKQRSKPEEIKAVILDLCSWKPLKSFDIGILLNRNPNYLVEKYLSPLIEDGQLVYTIPEVPTHTNQKYKTVDKEVITSESGRE